MLDYTGITLVDDLTCLYLIYEYDEYDGTLTVDVSDIETSGDFYDKCSEDNQQDIYAWCAARSGHFGSKCDAEDYIRSVVEDPSDVFLE